MEDSLYWIAYATQPSNIKTHAIDPSPLIPSGDATTSTTAGVVTEGQTTAAAGSVGAGGTSVTGLTVQQAASSSHRSGSTGPSTASPQSCQAVPTRRRENLQTRSSYAGMLIYICMVGKDNCDLCQVQYLRGAFIAHKHISLALFSFSRFVTGGDLCFPPSRARVECSTVARW